MAWLVEKLSLVNQKKLDIRGGMLALTCDKLPPPHPEGQESLAQLTPPHQEGQSENRN